MRFIYNVGLTVGFVIASPWLLYRFIRRKEEWQRLGIFSHALRERIGNMPVVWFHCASLGEVNAALPLIETFRQVCPGCAVVFSTITATGYDRALRVMEGAEIIYFPLDLGWAVRRSLRVLKPRVFVMVETEIWPNFLKQARKMGVMLMMASGRISGRSYCLYGRIRKSFAGMLDCIDVFSMQTYSDAERIIRLGADRGRVKVTGSLKFDSAIQPGVKDMGKDAIYESFGLEKDDDVFVAGSVRKGEEEPVLDAYCDIIRACPRIYLVIAPRHLRRTRCIEKLLAERKLKFVKRSALLNDRDSIQGVRVILIDTIGDLSLAYGIAKVVFVGGSLVPCGGHNILEPASLSKAVLFGPHMDNFREIADLFKTHGACIEVNDGGQLAREVEKLFKNPSRIKELGENAANVIRECRGAAGKNAMMVKELLAKGVFKDGS